MSRLHRHGTPRRAWRVWSCSVCSAALLAAPDAIAQERPAPPAWVPTVSADMGYGDYAGGASASQAMSLNLARPDRFWRFSTGHHRLLGEEAYSAGFFYQQTIAGRYRIGGGVGSGSNRSGGLAPRYHVSVTAGMDVIDALPVSLSYSRRRAARNESYVDRFGAGVTWYAPGPWIIGANTAVSRGHPGSTTTWSTGGGITYSLWRRMSLGVRADHGDGSYLLLPSQSIVEFKSWSYSVNFSRNVSPDASFRVSIGYSEYYSGSNVGFGFSRRW